MPTDSTLGDAIIRWAERGADPSVIRRVQRVRQLLLEAENELRELVWMMNAEEESDA
jgi:hypothetical protein